MFGLALAFSISGWFRDAFNELGRYLDAMDPTQWLVLASVVVAMGFLILRTGG